MALSQKGAGYAGRSQITDPNLVRALDDLASQIKAGLTQVNATPEGKTPAPSTITSLSVTAADGIYDAQIQDNSEVQRGIEYFLEYSTTPGMANPIVVHLGTSRNWRGHLGDQKLYWQAYSQYATSPPSAKVKFGSQSSPSPVTGGGNPGPALHPSTGSGTASNNGSQGGAGYGYEPKRTPFGQRELR